jgi:PilZ domain
MLHIRQFQETICVARELPSGCFWPHRSYTTVSNVIFMQDPSSTGPWRSIAVRDRRYSIRYPFAADAVLLDLETGTTASGVTSDLSIAGAFICSSKTFKVGCRVRATLTRKDQVVEALAVIRVLKPRVGMGVEFLDVEGPFDQVLFRWVEQLRRK